MHGNSAEIPGRQDPSLGDSNRGSSSRFRIRFLFRWNQNGILMPSTGAPQECRWRNGAAGTPDLGAFPGASGPPRNPFFSGGRRFAPPLLIPLRGSCALKGGPNRREKNFMLFSAHFRPCFFIENPPTGRRGCSEGVGKSLAFRRPFGARSAKTAAFRSGTGVFRGGPESGFQGCLGRLGGPPPATNKLINKLWEHPGSRIPVFFRRPAGDYSRDDAW